MALKIIRFRKIGIRGFLGLTTFQRRILTSSGIRSVLAPFRGFTNLRRKLKRTIGFEGFLPKQVVARGALPLVGGVGIANKFFTGAFGQTGPQRQARMRVEKVLKRARVKSVLGPLGQKQLRKPRVPSIKTSLLSGIRKFGQKAAQSGALKTRPRASKGRVRAALGKAHTKLIGDKKMPKTSKSQRSRPARPKSGIKPKLTKEERIRRQLEGRKRSGDIKNIYYPRPAPTARRKKRGF